MESKRERKFLLYAIVAIVGFIFVTNFFIPITYAVNDDTTMKSIASGAMTGVPDGHLIFVKYSLGAIIAFCYKIFNGIDWYGCTMLGIILFCTLLLIYRAKRLFKNNIVYGIISVLSVFIIVIFENFVNFQFTVVSAIAAATAIFFYNTIDINKEHYRREYAIVILLAWMSYCIRSATFIMAIPFAGISFLFKDGKWKEKIVVCATLVLGLVAITLTENAAYASNEWKYYQEYNEARSVVYDYYGIPSYEENKEFYSSIGMKSYDVENLEEYNLYMIDDIEAGKIQKIAEYNEMQQEGTSFHARVMACISLLIEGYFKNRSILVNMLAKVVILANLWFEIKNRKHTVWLNFLFLGIEAVLAFYLGYQGRVITRVMTALFLIEFFSALSIWCREHQSIMGEVLKTKISKFVLIGMVGLSLFMIFEVQENQKVQYEDNLEWEELQSFYQSNSGNIYFANTYSIWFYTDNFNIFEKYNLKNYSKLGEWSTFAPVEKAEMERYGIRDVATALLEEENVYLIYEKPSEAITNHCLEQYKTVEWIQVGTVSIAGENVPVYKLQGDKNDII